jgi:abelson tyrosine-protein kinase 1
LHVLTVFPGGPTRWQAPELLLGKTNFTPASDVYAFAMSCIEVITKGNLPFPIMNDEQVKIFVGGKLLFLESEQSE